MIRESGTATQNTSALRKLIPKSAQYRVPALRRASYVVYGVW